MINKYFKLSISIGFILLCMSCGVHREEFLVCIKPTILTPLQNNSFILQKPQGLLHRLKVSLNEKWSDVKLCIEDGFLSDIGCQPLVQDDFEIVPVNASTKLTLDGSVTVESPWGILAYLPSKQTVYLRGYVQDHYFWLATDQLQMLINKKNNPQAVALVAHNKESIDYLLKDRKLELTSQPLSWPCDPNIVQNN
jgi:hypothetical protein